MDRATLEALGREELVVEARRVGVNRPEVLTRVELVDEVLRLGTPNPVERKQVRGWLGVARDLLASAVERGLNLPDAAAMIRGDVRFVPMRPEQPPVATVTLAEIYGAQGHLDRAIGILDEVLDRESDHAVARRLRTRLGAERDSKRPRLREEPPEPPSSDLVAKEPDTVSLEAEEPDHVTLVPERVAASQLDAADESELETLAPARNPAGASEQRESAVASFAPGLEEASGSTAASETAFELGYDEPEYATLIPARRDVTIAAADSAAPDPVTLPPLSRASAEVGSESAPPTGPTGAAAPVLAQPGTEAMAGSVEPALASDDISEPVEPEEGPQSEPDAELPQDTALVLARTGAGSASVYFEVAGVPQGSGPLVVRFVEHRPRAGGVERVERDVPVEGPRGAATIGDLEIDSVVRAALGRKWDGHFTSAAVAAEVRVADGGIDVTWAPRPGVDFAAIARRSGLSRAGR